MVSQPHICDILSVLLKLVPVPEESLPAGLHPPIIIIVTGWNHDSSVWEEIIGHYKLATYLKHIK